MESVRFNPDCLIPGKEGEPFSRKGMVVESDKFKATNIEFYELSGWDLAGGLPTKTKLQELKLTDIAHDLGKRGLLK